MSDRAKKIAALRDIADLCESSPDLPVPDVADYCVLSGNDIDGRAEIGRIAEALRAAGRSVRVSERDQHCAEARADEYRAFYVLRRSMAKHEAQSSYQDVIVVDDGSVLPQAA